MKYREPFDFVQFAEVDPEHEDTNHDAQHTKPVHSTVRPSRINNCQLTDSSETISGSTHKPNLQPRRFTSSTNALIPWGNLETSIIQSPRLEVSSFLLPNQPSSRTIKSIPTFDAYRINESQINILPGGNIEQQTKNYLFSHF